MSDLVRHKGHRPVLIACTLLAICLFGTQILSLRIASELRALIGALPRSVRLEAYPDQLVHLLYTLRDRVERMQSEEQTQARKDLQLTVERFGHELTLLAADEAGVVPEASQSLVLWAPFKPVFQPVTSFELYPFYDGDNAGSPFTREGLDYYKAIKAAQQFVTEHGPSLRASLENVSFDLQRRASTDASNLCWLHFVLATLLLMTLLLLRFAGARHAGLRAGSASARDGDVPDRSSGHVASPTHASGARE
jgi:hypothetical protein